MKVEKINASRDNSPADIKEMKKENRLPYLNKYDRRFIAKRQSEIVSLQ